MTDQKPQPPRTEPVSISTRGWWRNVGPKGETGEKPHDRRHPSSFQRRKVVRSKVRSTSK